MTSLPHIIHLIQSRAIDTDLILIAIDGQGGSGKTTTALLVKRALPEAEIITTDDFLDENTHKIDIKELEQQILLPLSKGEPATYMEFDGETRKERTVQPQGIVIVEGIFSSHSSLQKYYDLTVWVKAPNVDERVEKRDGEMHENWETFHRPDEEEYMRNDTPEERATYVIENDENEKFSDLDALWREIGG